MDDSMSSSARSGQDLALWNYRNDATFVDGARLIAPSIAPATSDQQERISPPEANGSKTAVDGFQLALDGAYPLNNPILDLENRAVYSIDMVRLDFYHENQQAVCDMLDNQMVLATCETYTSNRIGSYRFLWIFRRADGDDGGYWIEKNGEVISDGGNNTVVLKVGYGVVCKGGNTKQKGFIEFNPNKCDKNGRKIIRMMEKNGCVFALKRYDLAIDYPLDRNLVRLMRDKRKYEFVISNKGGATEYLGTRNAPGRVKVYDKSGEQGIEEAYITRVELTVNAGWGLKEIKEHLPICVDFSDKRLMGTLLLFANMVYDMLSDVDETGKHTLRSLETVPERYFSMLPKDRRYKVKKALKRAEKLLRYSDVAIIASMEKANSYADIQSTNLPDHETVRKNDDEWKRMMGLS